MAGPGPGAKLGARARPQARTEAQGRRPRKPIVPRPGRPGSRDRPISPSQHRSNLGSGHALGEEEGHRILVEAMGKGQGMGLSAGIDRIETGGLFQGLSQPTSRM